MNLEADKKERLDKFLVRMLPEHSRSRLAKLVTEGVVLVDGHPQRPSFELAPGMSVVLDTPQEAEPHDLTPADIALNVIFEDEYLLVVDKPRGLASHPASSLKEPSLVNALLARSHTLSSSAGSFRPGIVHRLDNETTGLMVVAKNDSAHVILAKQIEGKTAERRYVAVVGGEVVKDRFVIDAPIGRDKHSRQRMAVEPTGKNARTHIKVLGTVDAGTVVAAKLETGRTHQIRVHLRSVGYPVVGDRVYAPKELQGLPLQLHAAFLSFMHPTTRTRVAFYTPPPADFAGAVLVTQEALEEW